MRSDDDEEISRDYFKEITGRKYDEVYRWPSYKESLNRIWKQSRSKYPLRLLGVGQGEVWITEESRKAHMHIIGTTGMGKSYFLLKMMIDDIKRGNGFCFL